MKKLLIFAVVSVLLMVLVSLPVLANPPPPTPDGVRVNVVTEPRTCTARKTQFFLTYWATATFTVYHYTIDHRVIANVWISDKGGSPGWEQYVSASVSRSSNKVVVKVGGPPMLGYGKKTCYLW